MWVYRSNRIEALGRALAGVVAAGDQGVFEPELIVVQSRGMERWLSLTLADELGVWLGARFPFPRTFFDEVMSRVLGETGPSGFSRESVTWCVAAELITAAGRPELAPVARYLADDGTGRKLTALAARIADAFDQYAVYRPELVLRWESGGRGAGEGDDWQAALWRAVVARLVAGAAPGAVAAAGAGSAPGTASHVAARRARFIERFRSLPELPAGFPRRLSLFGIPALPPLYLELLTVLAERLEVHLFLLSPSREHVGEVRSPRELSRELARVPGGDADALHLGERNPLFARFGHLCRDLERTLEAVSDYQEPATELFVEPGQDTLLHAVQHDLLHLLHRRPPRPPGPGAGEAAGAGADDPFTPPPLPIADTDGSIELHACAGPLREVEVLHERLRAAFEADPTLEPHEVIVMAPRIESYAPLIDAVFGVEESGLPRIPHRIADRSPEALSPLLGAVLDVLGVLAGRATQSEVAALLEVTAIQARFGLEAATVPRLVELTRDAGVRWGADAADRAAWEAPASELHTWRFGLTRLLLGAAMDPDEDVLFAGVAPLDVGADAAALGRLVELVDTLLGWRARLRAPLALAEQAALVPRLLADLFAPEPAAESELTLVREVAASLGAAAAGAGFVAPVALPVFRALLAERLPAAASSPGFLAGGVTFSALLPMRSLPFRIVCLLGLSDGEYPREQRRVSFDLVAASPRAGDRSVRHEDENLFLEVLLSARERLIVTYVGRSLHDDARRPPSPVLAAFIAALDEGFVVAPGAVALGLEIDKARESPLGVGSRRVAHPPLKRWTPRQTGVGATTYEPAAAAGARALARGPRPRAPFLTGLLPPPAAGELGLEELAAVLAAPARHLLRERLGVSLDERLTALEDREPSELGPELRSRLGAELLARALARPDGPTPLGADAAWELERARGRLPIGTVGRCHLAALLPEVAALAAASERLRSGPRLAPVRVAWAPGALAEAGSLGLVGVLDDLFADVQLRVAFTRDGRTAELAGWVRHLALSVARGEPGGAALPRRTVLVGRSAAGGGASVVSFGELAPGRARAELAALLGWAELAARAPLPFFPRASRAYAATLRKRAAAPEAAAHALAAAQRSFFGQSRRGQPGEAADPYVARLFGDGAPLGPSLAPAAVAAPGPRVPGFVALALAVYGPLLAAREDADDGDDEGDDDAGDFGAGDFGGDDFGGDDFGAAFTGEDAP